MPAERACLPLQIHPMQQKQVEQEEEYITNKLMKRLEQLKKEKAVLASEVGDLGAPKHDMPSRVLEPKALQFQHSG